MSCDAYYKFGQDYVLALLGIAGASAKTAAEATTENWLPELSAKSLAAPALAAGGLALGGVGGYKLLRRQRLSNSPALKNLQQQAGDKGFEVATHQPTGSWVGRALRRGLYGAPDISDTVHAAGRAGTKQQSKNTVLHHGVPGSNLPVEGAVNLNDGGLSGAMSNKKSFADIMKQVQEQTGNTVIPATEGMGPTLRAFEHSPDKMSRHLKDSLPEGWIVKPVDESLGTIDSFVNEATDFADPRWQRIMQNPESFILQEKIPIKQEYRVHTVNGVPFTATHRRLPEGKIRDMWNAVSKKIGIGEGGFAHLPAMGKTRKELMQFVEDANVPLQEAYKDQAMHQAFDVAQLPDGTFRLIESNPTPGTFNNPFTSRKLQEMVTGRLHKDKAMLGAAGIGAAGAAAGYGAGSIAEQQLDDAD